MDDAMDAPVDAPQPFPGHRFVQDTVAGTRRSLPPGHGFAQDTASGRPRSLPPDRRVSHDIVVGSPGSLSPDHFFAQDTLAKHPAHVGTWVTTWDMSNGQGWTEIRVCLEQHLKATEDLAGICCLVDADRSFGKICKRVGTKVWDFQT